MASAWRNFKNISSRPLFTIIFRPEMLKFHPYSILNGETMVGFVIICVLTGSTSTNSALVFQLPKVVPEETFCTRKMPVNCPFQSVNGTSNIYK